MSTTPPPRDPDTAVAKPGPWLLALMFALLAAGLAALWLLGNPSPPRNQLPPRFDYDLTRHAKIDPALVAYRQATVFPVKLKTLRAVAAGPDDRIYIAGDSALVILDAKGRELQRTNLPEPPYCMAVAPDGTRFIGLENRLLIINAQGEILARGEPAGPRARFTSVAFDSDNIFVADAGNKCVIRYDPSGKMIQRLAQRDPEHDVPGLIIPSPYCDVAVGTDGLVRVVNPGRHQIEFFTPDGRYEAPLAWGRYGLDVDCFCGCCNPVAIALLADDRVVTAEKGIPRVKIYSPDGRFECVVAAPDQLGATEPRLEETREEHKLLAVDLAVDRRDRILILDPAARAVRVFVTKEP